MDIDTDSEKVALLVETKQILRSLLLPHWNGLTLELLNDAFCEFEGRDIPFLELGFPNLLQMLTALPDTVHLTSQDGCINAFAVADASTAHIAELVQGKRIMKSPKFTSRSRRFTAYERPFTSTNGHVVNLHSVGECGVEGSPVFRYSSPSRRVRNARQAQAPKSTYPWSVRDYLLASDMTSMLIGSMAYQQGHPQHGAVIPFSYQYQIKSFMAKYKPVGIDMKSFSVLFEETTKMPFDVAAFKFTSMFEALNSLPNVITLFPKGSSFQVTLADWQNPENRLHALDSLALFVGGARH